ncbi:MAG: hypothetical protein RLZ98_3099, partial [Pseudomonadota bacterium]
LEWHQFLRRRAEQDTNLVAKLLCSRNPEEYWSAYASFWQQAAEDYGQEMSTVARI